MIEDLRKMAEKIRVDFKEPSINDVADKLEVAADEIERLREELNRK